MVRSLAGGDEEGRPELAQAGIERLLADRGLAAQPLNVGREVLADGVEPVVLGDEPVAATRTLWLSDRNAALNTMTIAASAMPIDDGRVRRRLAALRREPVAWVARDARVACDARVCAFGRLGAASCSWRAPGWARPGIRASRPRGSAGLRRAPW